MGSTLFDGCLNVPNITKKQNKRNITKIDGKWNEKTNNRNKKTTQLSPSGQTVTLDIFDRSQNELHWPRSEKISYCTLVLRKYILNFCCIALKEHTFAAVFLFLSLSILDLFALWKNNQILFGITWRRSKHSILWIHRTDSELN